MKDTKNIRVKNNTLNINKIINNYILGLFSQKVKKNLKNIKKNGRVFGELIVVLYSKVNFH